MLSDRRLSAKTGEQPTNLDRSISPAIGIGLIAKSLKGAVRGPVPMLIGIGLPHFTMSVRVIKPNAAESDRLTRTIILITCGLH